MSLSSQSGSSGSLLSLPPLSSDPLRRLCVIPGFLLAATQDGSLLLYSSASLVPELQRSWRLPHVASALAAVVLPSGSVVVMAGTQTGEIAVAGPGEEVLSVHAALSPGAITKLLLGPPTDGLGGILADENADGPRALFIAGSDGRISRAWLPEAGHDGVKDIAQVVAAVERSASEASVCAELFSPILDMELCPRTARLLVSTAERAAVISDALAAQVSPVCWVGSKPHKGRLSATFSDFFGTDAIIAPRPGSRLWVADSGGTVQRTLRFQSASGEGKAALGHLLTLRHDQVVSFARCDDLPGDAVGEPVVLLDLEAIAISHQWPAPPVVDAVPWHGGVLLGHPAAVSVLLLSDQPLVTCKALIAMHLTDRADPVCLADCLKELQRVQQSLEAVSAGEVLEGLAPLIEAISGISGREVDFGDFKQWVSTLEERQLESLRQNAGEGKHDSIRLIDAPLSNFPLASAEVDDEVSVDGKEDHASGIGDGEGLFVPDAWQRCLDQVTVTQPDLKLSTPVPIEALEAPRQGSKVLPEIARSLLPWLAARLKEEADDLAEPAALAFELLCAAEDWPGSGIFPRGSAEPWPRERLVLELPSFAPGSNPWPAAAALGLCHLCLDPARCEIPLTILDRCLFWANGMVTRPGAVGWEEVTSWIRQRLRPGCSTLPPWPEALEVRGTLWASHSLFHQAMAPESSVPVRRIFDAAVELFPKVLPWNIADWMSWTFQPVAAGQPMAHRLRREALLDALPAYVLRLLPSSHLCEELLLLGLSVALHRKPIEIGANPPVHASRCTIADSLLLRCSDKLGLEFCNRLRYPLGVLLLKGSFPKHINEREPAAPLEQIKEQNARAFGAFRLGPMQDLCFTDQTFEEVVLAALRVATPDADGGSTLATATELDLSGRWSAENQSRGELKRRCQDGRLNRWYDLALALWTISQSQNGSCSFRWRFVLDASTANPGLFAALAALSPSAEMAEVLLRSTKLATARGAFAEDSTASAEALWCGATGGWLQLPKRTRQLPPRPQPWLPQLLTTGLQQGLCKAGSGDFLWVSDDGLRARHLDDTGNEMHGVLMGSQPLTPCRAGAYFEVTLEEVRPGESPDGLTLGVTATSPDGLAPDDSPATLEHIPETWSLGYDGQMWDCKSGTLTQVDWDPRSLAEGDVVGLLVTASEGELLIFRNGSAVCAGPRGIPVTSRKLYAVVDLLGAARAVRWMPQASPP